MRRRDLLTGTAALAAYAALPRPADAMNIAVEELTLLKGVGVSYDPAASAFFARLTTQPTLARKTLYNNLFVSLRADGLLTKLDALYLMAAADSQAARQNLIQNAYNLTAVNSPTFTADRGYAGDGSTSYLNTGFNPATAVAAKYSLNAASIGAYDATSRSVNGSELMGAYDAGTADTMIAPYLSGNVFYGRVGDVGGSFPNASSKGRYLAVRSSATSRTGYKNGATIGTLSANVSAALQNVSFFIGGESTNGSLTNATSDVIGQACIGALALSDAAAFDAIIAAYLTAVGA